MVVIVLIAASICIYGAYASIERLSESEITKIINAPMNYSYAADGVTLIKWHGKQYSTVIRQYNKKPCKSRIEYKSHPLKGVIVYCDGKFMWRDDPSVKQQVCIKSTGCLSVDQKRKLFASNYKAYISGKTKLAGRNSQIVDIRDASNRLRKRLWIDTAAYVTLRSDEYNESGKITASTAFNMIDYNAKIPDSLFKRPSGSNEKGCENLFTSASSISELSKKVGFKVITPEYLPKGFHLDGYRLYNCSCKCGYKSAYIRYSNGMSGISVFECKKVMDSTKICGDGMHIPAEKANTSVHGVNIYIIADIKSSVIRKIAISFK